MEINALKSTDCKLRALEPTDLDLLYEIENQELVWEVSQTLTPYSRFVLKRYLENAHQDIFTAKQLRLVIELHKTQKPIGFIDLYDFDPQNKRVGVGILIFSQSDRRKGYATQALQLISKYVLKQLQLHQIYALIMQDNTKSIHFIC